MSCCAAFFGAGLEFRPGKTSAVAAPESILGSDNSIDGLTMLDGGMS
jgi:hypothetical protein